MLFKNKNYSETLIHICNKAIDRYTRSRQKEIASQVHYHDINGLFITDTRKVIHIDYCPFCGCRLDKDIISSETFQELNKVIYNMEV